VKLIFLRLLVKV